MKQADAVLRDMEALFEEYPNESTLSLVTRWCDGLRNEYQHKLASDAERVQNEHDRDVEQEYYSLDLTRLVREANNLERRYRTAHFRIKPNELAAWCKERGLSEKRIRAVAMGEEYSYKGYIQGALKIHALGRPYVPPKRIEFGDDVPDKPARKKVSLFGTALPVGVIKE